MSFFCRISGRKDLRKYRVNFWVSPIRLLIHVYSYSKQFLLIISVQFSRSCPTLCNTMNCSMPGFPVHHQLPEFTQTHVHWVSDAIQPSHPLVILFFSRLQFFPASGSFPVSRFFSSGDQSIGVSASASVLPMSMQDWFPLGWTGWISLQSKGLSRVFSNTTVQELQFFGTRLSL